jgi:NAD(P)-dependent dehydrogenase (short-subunit alcohol dehydrogenase family)
VPLTRDLADSVVVTGGSGGIGAATALRPPRRGAAVVAGARRPRATADVAGLGVGAALAGWRRTRS